MKIYISGKISGMEKEAKELFGTAERELQAQGFDTVNPMKLKHDHDKAWSDYMREDIKALCECDGIYMLKNWKDSKGARLERKVAVRIGMRLMYQEGDRNKSVAD